MKKLSFILGVHNHQPVGNFDYVFEQAYRKAYLPFIELLERHPLIKISMHYSGSLWEWIEAGHPEFLDRINALLKKDQIELIGGGFYEPILPIIPANDCLGQLTLMQEYLQSHFARRPRGFWLTERIWEPHIPSLIKDSRLEYTMLDDTHFLRAGFKKEALKGYFITEDQGNLLSIFPIDKQLRYLIPFHLAQEGIEYLRQLSLGQNGEAVILIDDGEKFGLWPGTHQWVYKEGWLEKFFSLLEENREWLELTTFSSYLDRFPAEGRAYLPTASYEEMLDWAGGFFRNFFVKYPEVNHMHKKMLYLSAKIKEIKDKDLKEARHFLYKGQCNCSYWHGIFGGLYLPHLRRATQENLLQAEMSMEKAQDLPFPYLEEIDFDCDGATELIIRTEYFNIYLDPGEGGIIKEWDYKRQIINLTDILSRRKEAYHKNLREVHVRADQAPASIHESIWQSPEEVEKYLFYDPYTHATLIDHVLSPQTILNDFKSGKTKWISFPGKRDYLYRGQKKESEFVLHLEQKNSPDFLKINKDIIVGLKDPLIDFAITLENKGKETQHFIYAHEFCLGCGESKIEESPQTIEFSDKVSNLRVRYSCQAPLKWWNFPLFTLSHSEKGFETILQGFVILAYLELNLLPGEHVSFNLKKEIIT